MSDSNDVVIIGGGAAGCATAYYLAKAGVKSTIVEREGIASNASGFNAGGLNPLQGAGIPGLLGPLAIESFRMHQELANSLPDESGIAFHYKTIAMINAAFDDSEILDMKETLDIFEAADADFSAHWLERDELIELEPRISADAIKGLYTYGNAVIAGYEYVKALAKASGAEVRLGEVTGLKTSGGRVTGVVLRDGELECGTVVIASGPWSGDAGEWLGVNIPVEPLKGEIVRIEPVGGGLEHDFSGAGSSLYQRSDGLVWVGATEERQGFDREPSAPARNKLLGGAVKLMPSLKDARIVRHTACLRPVTADWLPIVGKAPGSENVYLSTGAGKKGILISPGIGKATADLITSGNTELSIGSFAPERFS